MSNSSILPIDRTQSGATSPSKSGPASNGNEGILCIPQNSNIIRVSPSDCLVSYTGHLLEESYPSALMQSVYSTAPSDWASVCVCVCVLVVPIKAYIYIYIYILFHSLFMHIHAYTHTHTHTDIYIYIYIYICRDKERERNLNIYKHLLASNGNTKFFVAMSTGYRGNYLTSGLI